MNKTTLIVLTALSLAMASASAQAKTSNNKRSSSANSAPTTERVESHMAAPDRGGHSASAMTFGVGLSTLTPLPANTAGSLTAIVNVTTADALQILFTVPTTDGGVSIAFGALYKRTLAGNETSGFHAGAGFGLGADVGTFGLTFPLLMGVHHSLGNSGIAFHFDGGCSFNINTPAAGTDFNFATRPYSSLLGASVVYVF